MKINYNVTGAQRKDLVSAIGEIMRIAPVYAGAGGNLIGGERHRFSYVIMNITVTQNGEMLWDDRTDNETMNKVLDGLTERGYTFDRPVLENEEPPVFESLQLTEREELGLGHECRDPMGEDGMQASDVPEDVTDSLIIELPRDGFTDTAISNLEKLVESKSALIKKAVGAESLPVEVTDDTLRFPWFEFGVSADEVSAYTKFISALCAMAKEQKRITAKEKPVDNEKYAFRCFLLRLGFIGDDYKTERKILLRNLSGNGSFKSGERKQPDVSADETGSAAEPQSGAENEAEVNV